MVARIRTFLRLLLLLASESGQIGTGLAVISLVGTASILAAVVVTSGELGTEQFDQVFRSSIGRVSGTMEVRGSVVAIASGQPLAVDRVQFTIGTSGIGDPISLDTTSTSDRLVVAYLDGTTYDADVPYTATEIVGNSNKLLEPGESFHLTVRLADIRGETGPPSIGPNSRWTLELQAPVGGTVEISRVMPSVLDPVMPLH
jgi:archaellin